MRLYVGNLAYSATEEDVRALFAQYGEVSSVYVAVDRETGRSRGFAFVEYADRDSGEQAIEGTNGVDFGGRALVVNEARPRPERGGGGGFGGGGGGYGGGGGGFGGGGGGRGGGRGGRGGGNRREPRW